MPVPPRTSVSGVSANNIIEGSRKRAKLELESNSAFANSPASSTSRLPEASSSNVGPGSEEATQLGFKLLDVLINRIDEDETPITVPFLALPLRSDYPDYYELIKNPISIEQIRRRLQSRSYNSLEEIRNNLESICRNAKRYNLKGSEIYEKARRMHQIILYAFVELVEKGNVQPISGIIIESDPPLQQQSAQLALIEQPNRLARLDFDELDDQDVVGRVSLRLKKDDDIPYDEDEEDTESRESPEDNKSPSVDQVEGDRGAQAERSTSQVQQAPVVPYDAEEGDISSAQMTFDRDLEMEDSSQMDRSMLTLAGKFDRRKRPGPRGKRLKSTLRNLVAELKMVLNQSGQPITRFFLSLPSRLQYPDYYKVIQRPIALDAIEGKVSRKDYVNPYALVSDLRQMVENAQYYNEEGSEVWEAAEEIRQYVEGTTIPTMLADGFTLDPNDMRQSALPVEIAANSSVPAQAAAFQIQVERKRALENGTSTEMMDSVSPEMTARSLPQTSDHTFKVRLSGRTNASASPAALGDMQPPGLAPSSAGLGLSMSDNRFVNQGSRVPSQGSYGRTILSPGISNTATPTSYLKPTLPPSAVNGSSWQTTKTNGIHPSPSNNPYFATAASPAQSPIQGRSSFTASSMGAPAAATYMNGSLPFQKPTDIQIQGSQTDLSLLGNLTTNGNATTPRSSQHFSKRLPGEGPAFDPFKTNTLQVDSETTIVRNAVISQFNIRILSKDDSLVYRLMNDVTRIHSINLTSGPPNQWKCTVEMTPRDIVSRESSVSNEESRQWSISIHHNGKGIKPEGTIEEAAKENDGIVDTPAPTNRVQIEAGSSCQFSFSPKPGANIISVHIHPPPPNSALQEIIKDEKHPLRSKAKALLDLPERYRILVYCRA